MPTVIVVTTVELLKKKGEDENSFFALRDRGGMFVSDHNKPNINQ